MSPTRKTEIKRMMRRQPRSKTTLRFLLQDVEDPVNVGAAFRIADACKVESMLLTGISAQPPHKLIGKVGRGKDKRVAWRYEEDTVAAIRSTKAAGFRVYAVEITDDAVPYCDVAFAEKACLIVGHEDHGVTKKALAEVDEKIFIPMYGKGASLNVHVALAVIAFGALHHDRGSDRSGRADVTSGD